jgi:hypothetical protein
MTGAGNPLNYDYRDPRHVERYAKLVMRNADGSTEGKHPRDADVDVMREIHEPAPLLRVIRPSVSIALAAARPRSASVRRSDAPCGPIVRGSTRSVRRGR